MPQLEVELERSYREGGPPPPTTPPPAASEPRDPSIRCLWEGFILGVAFTLLLVSIGIIVMFATKLIRVE